MNVELQYKTGLTPKIIRTVVGDCCDWCRSADVPKDVMTIVVVLLAIIQKTENIKQFSQLTQKKEKRYSI